MSQGAFRDDVYSRLNVFAIHLPPLRERRDDVLQLSEAFLTELGKSLWRPPSGISCDARQLLLDYKLAGPRSRAQEYPRARGDPGPHAATALQPDVALRPRVAPAAGSGSCPPR
jgi:hypothetical protein